MSVHDLLHIGLSPNAIYCVLRHHLWWLMSQQQQQQIYCVNLEEEHHGRHPWVAALGAKNGRFYISSTSIWYRW